MIAIDLSSSWNCESIINIRRKFNPMADLAKFAFN